MYRPLHRLPDGDGGEPGGVGKGGAPGGVGAAGPGIGLAGEDGTFSGEPAAPAPPDADTGVDCQVDGVASCGVEYTGAAAPEPLRASIVAGAPPLEDGDPEGEERAKDGVEGDGAMPAPALEIGEPI